MPLLFRAFSHVRGHFLLSRVLARRTTKKERLQVVYNKTAVQSCFSLWNTIPSHPSLSLFDSLRWLSHFFVNNFFSCLKFKRFFSISSFAALTRSVTEQVSVWIPYKVLSVWYYLYYALYILRHSSFCQPFNWNFSKVIICLNMPLHTPNWQRKRSIFNIKKH